METGKALLGILLDDSYVFLDMCYGKMDWKS